MSTSGRLERHLATQALSMDDARGIAADIKRTGDTKNLRKVLTALAKESEKTGGYRDAPSRVEGAAVAWLQRYVDACERVGKPRSPGLSERFVLALRHFWPVLPSKVAIASCGVGAMMLTHGSVAAGAGGMVAGFYALLSARILIPPTQPLALPDPDDIL